MTAEEQKQIAIAKSLQTEQGEVEKINKIALSIDLAIFGFSENTLKVLLIRSDLEVYIICSANSYEFCNNYDCIDVTNQEHYIFNEYWEFRNHFIKEENK